MERKSPHFVLSEILDKKCSSGILSCFNRSFDPGFSSSWFIKCIFLECGEIQNSCKPCRVLLQTMHGRRSRKMKLCCGRRYCVSDCKVFSSTSQSPSPSDFNSCLYSHFDAKKRENTLNVAFKDPLLLSSKLKTYAKTLQHRNS